jgi:hypothetical protein
MTPPPGARVIDEMVVPAVPFARSMLLVDFAGLDQLAGGAILLFGSLILLVTSICHAARAGAS